MIYDLLAFGAVLLGRAREALAVLAHLGVVACVGGVALDRGTHLPPNCFKYLDQLTPRSHWMAFVRMYAMKHLAIETTPQKEGVGR